jgi:hypothetical protein
MDQLKKSLDAAFLDEDRVFAKIENKINRQPKVRRTFSLAMVAATVVLALLLGMARLLSPMNVVAGVVTVDLNPSLRIELSKDYTVLDVSGVNAEAQSMDLSSLKGLPIQDALMEIVRLTIEAGYLDPLALTSDYILITTVSYDGNDQTFNLDLKELLSKIQSESPSLDGFNLAFMRAQKQDLEDADDSDLPLWLYLLSKNNPDVLSSPTSTVQNYFEDEDLKTEFESEYGEVLEDDHEIDLEDLEEALDELEEQGIDVSEYRRRLATPGVDLNELKSEILVQLDRIEENEVDDDDDEISQDNDDDDEDDEDDEEDEEDDD